MSEIDRKNETAPAGPLLSPGLKFQRGMDLALEIIIALLMAAMVVVVSIQVLNRYTANLQLAWTGEVTTFLLIWIGLLGAAVAVRRKAHLGLDIATARLSPRNRDLVHAIASLFVAVFALYMVVTGYSMVAKSFKFHRLTAMTQIPYGCVYLIIPLSGLLIFYYAILDAITLLVKTLRPGSRSLPPA